jgi:putative hydrolase
MGEMDPTDAAPDPTGELLGNLAQLMGPMLLGMQSGMMVGNLSLRALGQYDLPIPRLAPEPNAADLLVVPANVDAFAADWSLEPDDVRLWVAVGELTHHAVLGRPHVRARLQDLLLDYVSGFEADVSSLELRLEDVDPTNPDALREALGDPQALLGAVQTDAQRRILVQLEALACAVVGYADHIVEKVGRSLVGQSGALSEALRRRRVERGDGERFVERLFGLELGQAQYDRGIGFVRGVVERAGEEGLSPLWRSERHLPTPPEVDAPGLWLERIALPD